MFCYLLPSKLLNVSGRCFSGIK